MEDEKKLIVLERQLAIFICLCGAFLVLTAIDATLLDNALVSALLDH